MEFGFEIIIIIIIISDWLFIKINKLDKRIVSNAIIVKHMVWPIIHVTVRESYFSTKRYVWSYLFDGKLMYWMVTRILENVNPKLQSAFQSEKDFIAPTSFSSIYENIVYY